MYTWWNRPIIVKIWTESLKDFSKSQKVDRLMMDIKVLMQEQSENILLVTSGAVGFWRQLYKWVEDKQLLAALGWWPLLWEYSKKTLPYGIIPAGFLVTHADIEDYEERRETFVKTIQSAFEKGNILPIVNENDPLSTEEMQALWRWADNDKNALLLAKLFHAKLLAIVTNTDGVLDESKSRINSIASSKITPEYISYICDQKSQWWTGWMSSKLDVARQAWESWIPTYIFDGQSSTLLEYMSCVKEWTLDRLIWWTIIVP